MLEDVETCAQYRFNVDIKKQSGKLLSIWDQRLLTTESSFKTREPILKLRRVLLQLLPDSVNLHADEDNCWLRNAKIARK